METYKQFQEIIDEESMQVKDIDLLPLCHTTTEGYFMNIFQSKFIKCINIYTVPGDEDKKEKVAYFFYGKPSYLVYEEGENFTKTPPITLIYEPTDIDIKKIRRILPFDSGGFPRYNITEGYNLQNFTYERPDANCIKAMVKLLYENNSDYLEDEIKLEKLEPLGQECWSFKEMMELYRKVKEGELEVSDQVYSIEVQFNESIEFKPKYVILPFTWKMSKHWSEQKFKQNFPHIEIEYYGMKETLTNPGKVLKAQKYQDLMRERVLDLVRTKSNKSNE